MSSKYDEGNMERLAQIDKMIAAVLTRLDLVRDDAQRFEEKAGRLYRLAISRRWLLMGWEAYPNLWQKYGLSIDRYTSGERFEEARRGHWLVVNYLEDHSEIAAKYKPGQTGEIKYFDVLDMAGKVQ